jgi:hypothetical protein
VSLPPARRRVRGAGSLLSAAAGASPVGASCAGASIVQALLTLTVLATVAALAAPGVAGLQASVAIRSAAGEVGVALFRARSLAISSGRNVGVKFRRNGDRWEWTVYADGNGNGVRTIDIDRGIDRPIASFTWPRNDVLPGILGPNVPDPGQPGSFLANPSDPIRFNASDICSFSPVGESTPGSVYLWDGHDRMAVVRVFGRSAKLRTLYYRRGDSGWKP